MRIAAGCTCHFRFLGSAGGFGRRKHLLGKVGLRQTLGHTSTLSGWGSEI